MKDPKHLYFSGSILTKPILRLYPGIQAVFEEIVPTNPFNYEFVDDEYMIKFRSEERIGNLATIFCVLAILISCLGLFGLSSFIVEQRTKEIGIRKVLGSLSKHPLEITFQRFLHSGLASVYTGHSPRFLFSWSVVERI